MAKTIKVQKPCGQSSSSATHNSVEQEWSDLGDDPVADTPTKNRDGAALCANKQREDFGRVAAVSLTSRITYSQGTVSQVEPKVEV